MDEYDRNASGVFSSSSAPPPSTVLFPLPSITSALESNTVLDAGVDRRGGSDEHPQKWNNRHVVVSLLVVFVLLIAGCAIGFAILGVKIQSKSHNSGVVDTTSGVT